MLVNISVTMKGETFPNRHEFTDLFLNDNLSQLQFHLVRHILGYPKVTELYLSTMDHTNVITDSLKDGIDFASQQALR